jgi:hypothetical protein
MTVQLNNGIRLLSGAMFDYNNPETSDVKIEDIAAALSKVCRFSGHIHRFYSVAQHSINASRIVPHQFAFDALMHDTSEAFTNDIPTPLKYAVPMFKDLETKIETAMAKKFGFTFPLADEVKLADSQMLMIEKLELKKDYSEWAVLDGIEIEEVCLLVDLSPWSPEEAERRFLERYEELRPK